MYPMNQSSAHQRQQTVSSAKEEDSPIGAIVLDGLPLMTQISNTWSYMLVAMLSNKEIAFSNRFLNA